MMKIFFATLIVIFVHKTEAMYECCSSINSYNYINSNRLCLDNSSIKLTCNEKENAIFMDENELPPFFSILDNGTLIDTSNATKPARVEYCRLNREESVDGMTTNSQILLCYDVSKTEQSFEFQIIDLQTVLVYISAAFVILTMLVYSVLPNLLDLQGKCTMHYLAGLAGSYILLGTITLYGDKMNDELCKTLPYLMYFSFFYMFFWLTTLSFHIWRITVKPKFAEKTVAWPIVYHIVGIGGAVTALMVIVAAHQAPWFIWNDIQPGFGIATCWFISRRVQWIYFYGPLTIILAINVFFYVWTLTYTWNNVDSVKNKKLNYCFKLCLRLCIIMGITWCFEVITFALENPAGSLTSKILTFMVDLLNALQGVLIFLVLVVFRKRVRRSLATKSICNMRFPNSWRYLEDEEMESAEETANRTIITYEKNEDVQEDVLLNS